MTNTARIHYILAHVVLAGVVIQFFLAGLGVFGAGNFGAHIGIGYLLVLVALVTLIAAAVARRAVTWSIALFAAVVVQVVLAQLGDSAPGVAALHALNAVVVLFLAVAVFRGAPPSLRPVDRGGTAGASAGVR